MDKYYRVCLILATLSLTCAQLFTEKEIRAAAKGFCESKFEDKLKIKECFEGIGDKPTPSSECRKEVVAGGEDIRVFGQSLCAPGSQVPLEIMKCMNKKNLIDPKGKEYKENAGKCLATFLGH